MFTMFLKSCTSRTTSATAVRTPTEDILEEQRSLVSTLPFICTGAKSNDQFEIEVIQSPTSCIIRATLKSDSTQKVVLKANLPEISPTSGYYTQSQRFYQDIYAAETCAFFTIVSNHMTAENFAALIAHVRTEANRSKPRYTPNGF